jgi:hypothetical protein
VPCRALTVEPILTLLRATPPRIAVPAAGLELAQLHTSRNPISGPRRNTPVPARWSAATNPTPTRVGRISAPLLDRANP